MLEKKEVKKVDFYFTIFELLKQDKNPALISKELSISKQRINYYLRRFKKEGIVEKKGYGTWEVKTSKNSNATNSALEVRGHGFTFKIPIKNLKNWDKKEELLTKRNINYITIHNNILRITFKKHKVWLSRNSIIIFFPQDKSYFAKDSNLSREQAVQDFKLFTNGLFRYLGINLEKFDYEIIKHHYSLTENQLAKDYNQRKEKLILESKDKIWGLIDNSLNLNEFETISKSSDKDNKIVQKFFNDLKENNPPSNSELASHIYQVTTNQVLFDKNFRTHLDILSKLGNAVDELKEQVKNLTKEIKQ